MKDKGIVASLSLQDTNALKGIAIMLMLIHHLFAVQNGLFNDYYLYTTSDGVEHFLIQEIGIFSKLCVAMFVFLSGYGLMTQAENRDGVGSMKSYYTHRFKKLFLNYWFFWLTFIPISIFVYGYSFSDAYKTNIAFNLLTDILGLHNLFISNDVTCCYNPSWWFYSCIIVLYALFPLLYKWVKRNFLAVLLVSIALSFLPFSVLRIDYYIISFVVGMRMAMLKIAPPRNIRYRLLFLALLCCFCFERIFNAYTSGWDCLIIMSMVFVWQSNNIPILIKNTLAFLGKHSMNIFLFHVFIIWWFKDYIYATHNSILSFITLLGGCIPVSIMVEYIKKYTVYKLI